MAELHHPEIILSDVRMPRMSGIDMLYKVREHTPDTVFIFMSGYSDKEYLKAAIKLRAVNYVEKPLDLTEIEQAVRTAAERHMQIVESRRSQDLRFNMYASRLAMSLPPLEAYRIRKRTAGRTVLRKIRGRRCISRGFLRNRAGSGGSGASAGLSPDHGEAASRYGAAAPSSCNIRGKEDQSLCIPFFRRYGTSISRSGHRSAASGRSTTLILQP